MLLINHILIIQQQLCTNHPFVSHCHFFPLSYFVSSIVHLQSFMTFYFSISTTVVTASICGFSSTSASLCDFYNIATRHYDFSIITVNLCSSSILPYNVSIYCRTNSFVPSIHYQSLIIIAAPLLFSFFSPNPNTIRVECFYEAKKGLDLGFN